MATDHDEAPRLTVIPEYEGEQELPPEVYVISALVQSGQYTPESLGLSPEHFMSFRQVNQFLSLYQRQAQAAPPLRLLLDKFPRFPYVPGVSAAWAAKQLHEAFQERHLLRTMAKVGTLISEGRIDAAGDAMREASRSSAAAGSIASVSAYRPIIRDETDSQIAVPVLAGTMTEHCRGILPGHLWYVAGIPGMGKSFRLMEHAMLAVEEGWDVAFFSLEMPAPEVAERIQRMIAMGSGYEYGSPEFRDLIEARSSEYGRLEIFTGTVSAADISAVCKEGTLIVIDYVSKLRTTEGTRSITDYRIAAAISGELKDLAMNCNVPVLSAVQFNRSAYDAKSVNMGHTADTDAYNKDADVMIGMKKMSETVILNTIMKNRHDVSGRKFYTRFMPGSARAVELSFDEAHEAMYEDAERSVTH